MTCIYFTLTINTGNIKNTQPSIGLISHFETTSKIKCDDGIFHRTLYRAEQTRAHMSSVEVKNLGVIFDSDNSQIP